MWCDDAAYPSIMCLKFAAPRQPKKFQRYQIFEVDFGSRIGTKSVPEPVDLGSRLPCRCDIGIKLPWKTRCPGRELLVLRSGRQCGVGLGVVDDFAQQLLAERRQRALPQFPRGFAFFD